MNIKFLIIFIFVFFSISAHCQNKDSLILCNTFANSSIPTISFAALEQLTYSKSDSLYVILFGTPSWCPPCKLAIDTLQKVVNMYDFKKSRFILIIWEEMETQIKKSIKYFESPRITLEKYFCYSNGHSFFRDIPDMGSIPKMLLYKNGVPVLIIEDASDFMLGCDVIAKKIRDANKK